MVERALEALIWEISRTSAPNKGIEINMLGTQKKRLLAVAVSGLAAFGLVATATNLTGAYFSEAKGGNITGTIGAVHVATSGGNGGNGLDFAFDKLMPGTPQTITVNYQNTGDGPEDIHLHFPNIPALHALNNMGRYGEVHIADSSSGPLFDSANLNDDRPDASGTCGGFSPSGCWPVPTDIVVRSNLPAGGTGSFTFTFGLTSKWTSPPPVPVFNPYPSPGALGTDYTATPGAGLPYQVVATQAGH
jgi:hypothetical protein